jgi:hypothetical protein
MNGLVFLDFDDHVRSKFSRVPGDFSSYGTELTATAASHLCLYALTTLVSLICPIQVYTVDDDVL